VRPDRGLTVISPCAVGSFENSSARNCLGLQCRLDRASGFLVKTCCLSIVTLVLRLVVLEKNNDDRAQLAVALDWATRSMTISAEMAVPGLVGYWLDGKFHTGVILTLCGVGLGFALGTWHLVLLARAIGSDDSDGNGEEENGDS
jgi:hypothetical protein